ncbi:hypothetical protein A2V82_16170 [candidate division KSB1 bacterium RBG_16_48_16]|nr:MAG: hypothetical protein A2V82_16170 [candidate division KSB1 bacterium RBG_16_48_16]
MKKIFLFSLLFASLIFLAGKESDKSISAAKELEQRFLAAANVGDISGIMSCYWKSPDLVLYPPDEMEQTGFEEIKAGFEAAFKHRPNSRWEIVNSSYEAFGDAVVCYGIVKVTTTAADGKNTEMQYRVTSIAARKDGKWVYIHDHASVPMSHETAKMTKRE